ncbi:RNA polymerase sigma factor [Lacibacter sp. H375]|uniref:RNA polymerase sigma factor n=1 Tax=Lacibacter sp. H375 TaxID=3133424 RepID=UPI0030C405E9
MDNGSTDKEIITRVLKGDQRAYEVIVNRYQSFVFTIAFRYAKNREDAEELAQNAFIKAYRCLNDYRGDAKFSTWLYTIVTSLCLTFLRKKKLQVHSIDQDHVFELADQQDAGMKANIVEEKSKIKMVNDAIALLPPDDAKLLLLFYKGEQSLEEIGLILGIQPNNAKVKLHRARQKLREKMEQHFSVEVEDYIHS